MFKEMMKIFIYTNFFIKKKLKIDFSHIADQQNDTLSPQLFFRNSEFNYQL